MRTHGGGPREEGEPAGARRQADNGGSPGVHTALGRARGPSSPVNRNPPGSAALRGSRGRRTLRVSCPGREAAGPSCGLQTRQHKQKGHLGVRTGKGTAVARGHLVRLEPWRAGCYPEHEGGDSRGTAGNGCRLTVPSRSVPATSLGAVRSGPAAARPRTEFAAPLTPVPARPAAHARAPRTPRGPAGSRARPRRWRADGRGPAPRAAHARPVRPAGKGHGPRCMQGARTGRHTSRRLPSPSLTRVPADPRSRCRRLRPVAVRRPHGQRVGAGRIRARGRRRGLPVSRPRAPRARATLLRAARRDQRARRTGRARSARGPAPSPPSLRES